MGEINKILFIPFDFDEFTKIREKYSASESNCKYFLLYEESYEHSSQHLSVVYEKYNIINGEHKNYISHEKDKILTQVLQIEIPTLYQQTMKMVASKYESSTLERILPETLWLDYKEYIES
jgi:hypothetical protein